MKTYIILGMHRSATSFLSHALKNMGVNVGRVLLGPAGGNPEGHFENGEFLAFNEKLLKEAGGTWSDPPDEKKIIEVASKYRQEIKELIKRNKDELWTFKDPRTSLTIKAYLPHILEEDDDPFIFACFRKPDKVATSLNRRDKMPVGKGRGLANEYNRRILSFLKEFLEVE